MSSHKRRFLIKVSARRDIKDIAFYTRQTWGDEQTDVYIAKIEAAFAFVHGNPLSSPRSLQFPERYRAHPVGSHVIIYRVDDASVEVVRVMHQRMLVGIQLSDS